MTRAAGMNPAKLLARAIMLDERVEWSVQGFGMLRTYLKGANLRLHIWDPDARVDHVTDIHTHPWDLYSTVIVGELVNELYMEEPGAATHMCNDLQPGPGGHLLGTPRPVHLDIAARIWVPEGKSYSQTWEQLHRSVPEPYTVTLVERRIPPGNDPDRALTYQLIGEEWVSAEPRDATREEVDRAVSGALERWSW